MQMDAPKNPRPTVSVVVIAYNSAKTILETLDSTYAQTYSPLELIVADDASTDDTATIAREWIDAHRSRFVRTEIIVAEKNGGIPANLNRGIGTAQGVLMKSIAADDILLPNCIEDNVAFMNAHPEATVVFSKIREFSTSATGEKKFAKNAIPQTVPKFFELSPREQHDELLSECCINAPSGFFRTDARKRSPYNPLYPAMEDWPKWLQLTGAGTKLFFTDKETVLYRVGDSVSAAATNTFYSTRFMDSRKLFYLTELRAELVSRGMKKLKAGYDREFLRYDLTMALLGNKKTPWTSFCRHVISRFLKIFVR